MFAGYFLNCLLVDICKVYCYCFDKCDIRFKNLCLNMLMFVHVLVIMWWRVGVVVNVSDFQLEDQRVSGVSPGL